MSKCSRHTARRRGPRLLALSAALALFFASGGALLAAPKTAEAWFDEGRKAFEAHALDEAEMCFREAWKLKQTYDVAGGLGQTLLDKGSYAEAAEFLSASLRLFPPTASAQKRERSEELLKSAKEHVGSVRITVNVGGARVMIDERALGTSPLPDLTFATPGIHNVRAERTGYQTAAATVEAAIGSEGAVTLALVPDGGASPVAAGVGFGIGGAAILASIGVGVASSTTSGHIDDLVATRKASGKNCPAGSTDSECEELRSAVSERDRLSNAAIVVGIAGGLLVVATGIYFGVADAKTSPEQSFLVVPVVGPTEAGIGILGSF